MPHRGTCAPLPFHVTGGQPAVGQGVVVHRLPTSSLSKESLRGRGHHTTVLPNAQDSSASPTHCRRDAGTLFSYFQLTLRFI
ncbi:unnamed protein product [Spirodela intermedia]|uniref:Uncharacterized protein n=1 Tax=Spirodela intermedia TaxID=51605 RepID=A0A7I8JRW2_SPIIN|nr:unnamed protein product [Spirodela intermedia]CAA6672947.1 unnamed protein product [Spirodela intermedia]